MADFVIAGLILTVLPLALAVAAISDLFTMIIPNRVSAVIVIAFLLLAPLSGLAWSAIGMNIVAGLIVFSVCFALFAFNIMGGGDAKLMTAAALWFGFDHSLLVFLVAIAFVGGGLTLLFLFLRAQAFTVMAMGIPLPASVVSEKKIPYAIAIAIGGFLSFQDAPIVGLAMQMLS
ncbi:peptidase [Neorhizobium lilium]|uniref:Peptidase n=1 Tax=Neorhizobium lilium TaxID=2503024 RepID=A0A444LEW5_9HYPH|nr:prepilin peptidase [Neorhizobium lilium]RWX76665.1 peptidase [Neorhizobium lilium]